MCVLNFLLLWTACDPLPKSVLSHRLPLQRLQKNHTRRSSFQRGVQTLLSPTHRFSSSLLTKPYFSSVFYLSPRHDPSPGLDSTDPVMTPHLCQRSLKIPFVSFGRCMPPLDCHRLIQGDQETSCSRRSSLLSLLVAAFVTVVEAGLSTNPKYRRELERQCPSQQEPRLHSGWAWFLSCISVLYKSAGQGFLTTCRQNHPMRDVKRSQGEIHSNRNPHDSGDHMSCSRLRGSLTEYCCMCESNILRRGVSFLEKLALSSQGFLLLSQSTIFTDSILSKQLHKVVFIANK